MRKMLSLSLVAGALAVAGCGASSSPSEAMTADLERDLALASTARPSNAVVSAIEGGPTGAPSGNEKGARAPVAVRKKAPRPSSTPVVQEVASAETAADIPAPQTTATVAQPVPAPAPTPEPAVTAPVSDPTPAELPGSGPSAGNGDEGMRGSGRGDTGNGGGRRGGGWGGIMGVIIRGGTGGVDHCEPHGDRRRRGGGDVIGTMGNGRIGGIGGVIQIGGGDMRGPVGRPTYPRY